MLPYITKKENVQQKKCSEHNNKKSGKKKVPKNR